MSACRCGGVRKAPGRPCRECAAAQSRSYRHRHPEKIAAVNRHHARVWRQANAGRIRDYDHARRATDAYRAAERLRHRERRSRNPATIRSREAARTRTWRARNPARVKALRAALYYGDHERQKLLSRIRRMRRHARKQEASGEATLAQVAARVAYYGWRCWMCGIPWEEIDHVIPLARGGSNWPSNLRPACAKCNGRKWAHKPTIAKALAT